MRVAGAILFVVVAILGIWAWLAAPCWVYSLSQPNDTPLRCWNENSRR